MSQKDITKHHRRCKSNGGGDEESNISYVPASKHQAYHTLFQNMEAYEIAELLNNVWIDRRHFFVVKRRHR